MPNVFFLSFLLQKHTHRTNHIKTEFSDPPQISYTIPKIAQRFPMKVIVKIKKLKKLINRRKSWTAHTSRATSSFVNTSFEAGRDQTSSVGPILVSVKSRPI